MTSRTAPLSVAAGIAVLVVVVSLLFLPLWVTLALAAIEFVSTYVVLARRGQRHGRR